MAEIGHVNGKLITPLNIASTTISTATNTVVFDNLEINANIVYHIVARIKTDVTGTFDMRMELNDLTTTYLSRRLIFDSTGIATSTASDFRVFEKIFVTPAGNLGLDLDLKLMLDGAGFARVWSHWSCPNAADTDTVCGMNCGRKKETLTNIDKIKLIMSNGPKFDTGSEIILYKKGG